MTIHSAAWFAMLTAGTLALAPHHAAAELQVEYQESRLSVSASDVSLSEVLRAIGAKVGFTVADAGGSPQPVTVSMQDASVDDVLRQLLRAQNHTILYRESAAAEVVDRIVLLGRPGQGGADVAVAPPAASGPPPVVGAPPPAAWPAVSPPPAAPALASTPADQEEVTVGDMLRSHALSGAPAQTGSQPDAAAASPAAPTGVPPSLEESLAETTRRAQQGLSSLVEGLQRATQSLQQAPAAPATPTPGR